MLNCKRRRKSEKILWSLSRHGDNSVKTFDSDCYTRTLLQSVTACRLHAGRQHVCRDVRSLWNEFLLRTTWTRTATVVLVQYTVQCLYRLPYLLSTTTSHTERCKLIMSVTVDKKKHEHNMSTDNWKMLEVYSIEWVNCVYRMLICDNCADYWKRSDKLEEIYICCITFGITEIQNTGQQYESLNFFNVDSLRRGNTVNSIGMECNWSEQNDRQPWKL